MKKILINDYGYIFECDLEYPTEMYYKYYKTI